MKQKLFLIFEGGRDCMCKEITWLVTYTFNYFELVDRVFSLNANKPLVKVCILI